jgi:endonuclease-8
MPEGDTVWNAARRLRAALEGQQLTRSDFRVPEWATLDLSGQVVDEVDSRGKHLFVRVGEVSIHTHLKMEGVWHVYPRGATWRRPAHTARLVLDTATHQAVGFSLGIVEVLQRELEDDAMSWLGPDLLGPDWSLDEAVSRVRSDPVRPVFLAILDQRNVAGFGNEYANEICFLHGLLPTRPVRDVPDVGRVIERGRRLIVATRARVQRVFTGAAHRGPTTWVYGRARKPCRRCGTRIREGELGDDPLRRRVVYWCPRCQT